MALRAFVDSCGGRMSYLPDAARWSHFESHPDGIFGENVLELAMRAIIDRESSYEDR